MKKGIMMVVTIVMMIVAAACGSNQGGNTNGNTGGNTGSASPEPSPTVETTEPPATSYDKIVLGTSADYAPYEFHTIIDGVDTIVGFDIEIAKEIAKDLGAELEVQDLDFDSLLMALNTDKIVAGKETEPFMIKVRGLHKSYGKNKVLKGITTTIDKGEVVVVIGPSGSGKSTFLRCINRLEEPTKGQILLENVVV